MLNQWNPACPKCGKLTNRVVEPPANQVFAGRLSPRVVPMGERVRCPRCATWFPIAPGTRWEQRAQPIDAVKPEGSGAEIPEEGED